MNLNEIPLSEDYELLLKVTKLLEHPDHAFFEDQKEFILGVMMLLLDLPTPKRNFRIRLPKEIIDEIEGKLLDKICAVISKTYLMKGEEATIADDVALEKITDYLLEHNEFIIYKNQKRILRKPRVSRFKRKGSTKHV